MSAWSADRRGIIAMAIAMTLFSLSDAMAKLALQTHPVGQFSFIRGIILLAGVSTLLVIWPQPAFLKTICRPAVLGRSLLDTVVMFCVYVALMHMRLSDLAAINLVSPLILILLAVVLLKEHISRQQWLAIAAGVIGAIIVVRPDPATFNPWVGFAFLGVLLSAGRDLITRQIHLHASTLTLVFASGGLMSAVSLLGGLVETWLPLSPSVLLYGAGAAVFLGVGNFLAIFAVRTARLSLVAPFRYLLIVSSSLLGYLIFSELPDRSLFIGGALIVGAGLYTLHRQAVHDRVLASKPHDLA